jgi:hypothetical protein
MLRKTNSSRGSKVVAGLDTTVPVDKDQSLHADIEKKKIRKYLTSYAPYNNNNNNKFAR